MFRVVVRAFIYRTETAMFDDILGGGVALVLLCYLVYALIRPERF